MTFTIYTIDIDFPYSIYSTGKGIVNFQLAVFPIRFECFDAKEKVVGIKDVYVLL